MSDTLVRTDAVIRKTSYGQLGVSSTGRFSVRVITEDTPSPETIKAVEEARAGRGMTQCADVDDLMRRLGA
jgi:hypothetical protein